MNNPVQFYEEPKGGLFDLLREPAPYGPMTEQAARINDKLNEAWERCKIPVPKKKKGDISWRRK
jgi:hypothetical protein